MNETGEQPRYVAKGVAQAASLLYRRLPTCERPKRSCDFQWLPSHTRKPADWQSAIQQAGSLRYLQRTVTARRDL